MSKNSIPQDAFREKRDFVERHMALCAQIWYNDGIMRQGGEIMLAYLIKASPFTPVELLIRMFVAILTGCVVGIEREYKNRPAGCVSMCW